jgi:predicted nucleotide-binding protein
MKMISRFRGKENLDRFIAALRKQVIIQGDETLATELSDKAKPLQLESGDELIVQDGVDDEIYFILAGELSIVVNGRAVAIRKSGEHVGEMALIDPSARRSASVVAIKQTVVAKISGASFRSLADKHPQVWRIIAEELGERLRQRNRFVPSTNLHPVLFIGSSKESLPIAETIESGLGSEDCEVRLWTNEVFSPSQFPITDLEKQIREVDFAALVLGPDDEVLSRNQKSDAPRDNVIFELGLFMGALSHERTFMIVPQGHDIKIPTDLLGLTPISYKPGDPDDLPALIAPVCNKLRRIINKLGVK